MKRVSRASARRALVAAALFALAAACAAAACVSTRQSGVGGGDSVTVDLPATNEVRIENQRGGVDLEVWGEKYLAVASLPEDPSAPASGESPVQIDRGERLLTVSVAPATRARPAPVRPAGPARRAKSKRAANVKRAASAAAPATPINLKVRVPARARVVIVSSSGAVEVRGVPARLEVQTVAGDVRVSLPASSDADIMARTLYGTIALGAGFGADARGAAGGRFATRLGAGSRLVRLSTVRGHVALERSAQLADVGGDDASSVAPAPRASEPSSRRPQTAATTNQRGADEPPALNNEPRAPEGNRRARPPVLTGANDPGAPPRPAPAETPKPGAPIEVGDDEVLTVDTNLVTLNFSVVDRKSGRGLQNLIGGDFKVFEDRVEQQITHFEAANAPFDLLLLVDLSGSTARVNELIRASARRFVDSVRASDRVGVVAFAAAPRVVSPLTSDKPALRSRIDAMGAPQGDTKLYDAVAYALEYLSDNSPRARRRAVVLLTDGLDSALPNVQGDGSQIGYADLRRRVQEFDGLFYSIATDNYEDPQSPLDVQPETYDLAWDRLEELTQTAGGLYYEADKLEDVAGIYERVVEDLGTVYSVSYAPTNKARDGRWRAVGVRLPRRPEAITRGRSGYYAK
ncbi:MAG TPA: VWA domain-containing protein [Pyrinomonadaceae bacterium]|jgi:VWFA-related protein|nr:VWA domain-containing protein [Pyrinomonadaceae bacterium]